MIKENSKYELRHVLYCDLLGFSKYSKSDLFEANKCLRIFKQLDELIEEATKPIGDIELDEFSDQKVDYIVNPEAIYCSDSIVISTPATNIDAIWLFDAAARIQNWICAHGFLVRGAIVTGNLYHSGNTIFGPAIVDAVEKDKSGGPPVIVIDRTSLDYFCSASSDEDREIVKIRKYQLVADDDHDIAYIDPFGMAKIYTNQPVLHLTNRINLECWRTLVETGLKSHNISIFEKYVWIAKRFNKVISGKASNIKPIIIPKLKNV